MTCACQSCNYLEPQSQEEEEEAEEGGDEETIEENDDDESDEEETIKENDECEAYQPGVAGYDDSVERCRDNDRRFISSDDIGC